MRTTWLEPANQHGTYKGDPSKKGSSKDNGPLGDMAGGQNQSYHFGVVAPPILEPILVGIGMFTQGTGF